MDSTQPFVSLLEPQGPRKGQPLEHWPVPGPRMEDGGSRSRRPSGSKVASSRWWGLSSASQGTVPEPEGFRPSLVVTLMALSMRAESSG